MDKTQSRRGFFALVAGLFATRLGHRGYSSSGCSSSPSSSSGTMRGYTARITAVDDPVDTIVFENIFISTPLLHSELFPLSH